MRGLVEYFCFFVFMTGFARFLLESFGKHKNDFLRNVSLLFMAVSGGAYYCLGRLDEMEIENRVTFFTQYGEAILFLTLAFLGAFVGFLWFKRLK